MGVICYKKRRTPQTTFGARDLKFAKKEEEEEEEEEERHEYFLGTTSENAPLDNYYQSARFHACSRECTIRLKFRAMSL